MSDKKKLGQYFTINKVLQQKVCEFIRNDSKRILEPSCGRGDLVVAVRRDKTSVDFDLYEIDGDIKMLEGVDDIGVDCVDFLKEDIGDCYGTIIGNPPFVRTRSGNLYIDFIPLRIFILI